MTKLVAPAVIIVLLGMSLFYFNWLPWSAAQQIVQPGDPQTIVDHINVFPPLATTGRQELVDAVAQQFQQVPQKERQTVYDITSGQLDKMLASEPKNLMLRLSAARFYRAAAQAIPTQRTQFLTLASQESDTASVLGPHTIEAHQDHVIQVLTEASLNPTNQTVQRAKQAVADWKTWNPVMDNSLKTQFDAPLAQVESMLAASTSTATSTATSTPSTGTSTGTGSSTSAASSSATSS